MVLRPDKAATHIQQEERAERNRSLKAKRVYNTSEEYADEGKFREVALTGGDKPPSPIALLAAARSWARIWVIVEGEGEFYGAQISTRSIR